MAADAPEERRPGAFGATQSCFRAHHDHLVCCVVRLEPVSYMGPFALEKARAPLCPDFLQRGTSRGQLCAAFFTESRMQFGDPIKLSTGNPGRAGLARGHRRIRDL